MESLEKYYSDNPERLSLWIKEASDCLQIAFGVDNLSNIELFHLKKITEDTLARYDKEKSGPDSESKPSNLGREIATRFLMEAYGIDPDYIEAHTKTEEDEEGFLE